MIVSVTQLPVALILVSYGLSILASPNFLQCDNHIDCLCPRTTVNFECTVVGAIATVWKGSFFDCPSDSIVLRHRVFAPGINGTCNNGEIVATGIEVVNNSYSSQLVITVDPDMNNGSVECIRDGSMETTVGTCHLVLTSDFYLPTDGIRISAISSEQFSLHWSPPNRCPFVTNYIITAIDCGVCPNTTSDAFITCTNLVINGQICSITIQARACENGHKRSNDIKFSMLLKAPDIPKVNIIHYKTTNTVNHNTVLSVKVKEMAPFNITAGIDGSATSFTITYIDSVSGSICDSSILIASTCESRVCTDWFEISSSQCYSKNSSNITVVAFATNVLGDGPPSNIVLQLYMPNELEGCPKCTCELNFTVTIIISFSLIAAVLIIIVAIAILLRKIIKGRNNQKNKENKPIENIIYEDIEQHQPSLSFCDTTENIAYSNTASCK